MAHAMQFVHLDWSKKNPYCVRLPNGLYPEAVVAVLVVGIGIVFELTVVVVDVVLDIFSISPL